MRHGVTLVEVILALVICAIVTAAAVPSVARVRDRAAVHGATSVLVSALADTRHLSTRWQRRTAIRFDTARGVATVHAGADTLSRVPLRTLFQVSLGASRDSIAFYPTGLGYGAANTRLIVSRGAVAETVTVSRAGRVRR